MAVFLTGCAGDMHKGLLDTVSGVDGICERCDSRSVPRAADCGKAELPQCPDGGWIGRQLCAALPGRIFLVEAVLRPRFATGGAFLATMAFFAVLALAAALGAVRALPA